MAAGLKTIIVLSFILAIGFLLVILSSALYHKYHTLMVVATYVLAPVPNWLCGRAASGGYDDFMDSGSNGGSIVELGRFLTGFLVVMGIALPIVLAHTAQITATAAAMAVVGGLLIYGTIVSFTLFFREEQEF